MPLATASPNQRFMVPTSDLSLLDGSLGSPTIARFRGSKILALRELITPPKRPPSRTVLPPSPVTDVPKRDSEILLKIPFLPSLSPKNTSETLVSKAFIAFDTAFIGAARMDLNVTFPLSSRKMLPDFPDW